MRSRDRKADRHEPIQIGYVEVTSRPDESGERMVRRFMKKVREDGVLYEFRVRQAYEKPSVVRRRKRARARFMNDISAK